MSEPSRPLDWQAHCVVLADRVEELEALLRRVLDESSISYDVSGCEDLIPSIRAALDENAPGRAPGASSKGQS